MCCGLFVAIMPLLVRRVPRTLGVNHGSVSERHMSNTLLAQVFAQYLFTLLLIHAVVTVSALSASFSRL